MMEILQTIWTALTTENEIALNIIGFFSCFIDVSVNMFLFITIFNIKTNSKSQIIYIATMGLIAFLARNFIQDPYGTFLNLTVGVLFIKIIFRTTWFKSFLSEFISVAIIAILELFLQKFCLEIIHISYRSIMFVPIYRLFLSLIVYLFVYLLYRIIKYCKFYIDLDNLPRKNKILFIINAIFGIVAVATQIYLMAFYSSSTPIFITIITILSLIAYFSISIYSLLNTSKLATTSQNLEEAQLYNKTLTLLHDGMREFKHDFHNIIQGIGGYIETNNMEGLKKYYSQLLKDCNRVNNLTALNPGIINNPAIYNIMASKYHKADEIGVQINLGVFIDLNEIEKYMKIYEFTRILGILMDNAIEASSECENKVVHVSFRKEEKRNRLVMVIENTYANKDIDINRIFDKDFSTKSKKTNSGLGLWEIRQILKKNNNLDLYTSKNEEYFIQEFAIYY